MRFPRRFFCPLDCVPLISQATPNIYQYLASSTSSCVVAQADNHCLTFQETNWYYGKLPLAMHFETTSSRFKSFLLKREAFPRLRGAPHLWKSDWHSDQAQMQQTGKQRGLTLPIEWRHQFWKKTGYFGKKHSENGQHFFHAFLTYTKSTFCTIFGQKCILSIQYMIHSN